jgi:hypothetical protein
MLVFAVRVSPPERVEAMLDQLGTLPRDDAVREALGMLLDRDLDALAATATGRRLLTRFYDELTSGSYSEEDAHAAERVLDRFTHGIDIGRYRGVGAKTLQIPISSSGLSTGSFVQTRFVNGKVWIKVHVTTQREDYRYAKNLPLNIEAQGLEFEPDEIVGLTMLDSTAAPVFVPAMQLLLLGNQTDTEVLSKMTAWAAAGATAPFGTPAAGLARGFSETAPVLSRAVGTAIAAADAAAVVVGFTGLFIGEVRTSLLRAGGESARQFLGVWDVIEKAVAIYGVVRVFAELGASIKESRRLLRETDAAIAEQPVGAFTAEETQRMGAALAAAENRLSELQALAKKLPTPPRKVPIPPRQSPPWSPPRPNQKKILGPAEIPPPHVIDAVTRARRPPPTSSGAAPMQAELRAADVAASQGARATDTAAGDVAMAASSPTRGGNLRREVPEYPVPPQAISKVPPQDALNFFKANLKRYPSEIRDLIRNAKPLAEDVKAIDSAIKEAQTARANMELGRPAQSTLDPNKLEWTAPFSNSTKGRAPGRDVDSARSQGVDFEAGATLGPRGERFNQTYEGITKDGQTIQIDAFRFRDLHGVEVKMPLAMSRDPRFALRNYNTIVDQMRRQARWTRDWGLNPYLWELFSLEDMEFAMAARRELANEGLVKYIRITTIF